MSIWQSARCEMLKAAQMRQAGVDLLVDIFAMGLLEESLRLEVVGERD